MTFKNKLFQKFVLKLAKKSSFRYLIVRNLAFILIVVAVVIFFIPFLFNPNLITNRNNDLQEFKLVSTFFKKSILENHSIPIWQTRNMMGSPLLGDPQGPVGYIINYALIVLTINGFYMFFFFIHFLIAALGTFLLARIIGVSKFAALSSATIYALSPKFSAHFEAGHSNLLAAYAWVPFVFWALAGIAKKPTLLKSSLLAFAMSAIFLNHVTTFLYVFVLCALYLIVNLNSFKKRVKHLFIAIFVFCIIAAPQFTVSLKYFPLTTRSLVRLEDVGPNVVSMRHYLHSILSPYTYGLSLMQTETVLHIGSFAFVFAIIGFFYLSWWRKVQVGFISFIVIFLSLGTKTPLFVTLLNLFPSLLIFRITTRSWFAIIIFVALLSGITLSRFIKTPKVLIFIALVLTLELSIFNWKYFQAKPSLFEKSDSVEALRKVVGTDPGYYRIYCTTGCLDISELGKGSVNVYNPVMLRNYYHLAQDAGGYGFSPYTLVIPPYQSFVDKPQPLAEKMGKLSVRYLISPWVVTTPGFQLKQKVGPYYVYRNEKELPKAYLQDRDKITPLEIIKDLPGKIEVKLPQKKEGTVIISEPYMPFWEFSSNNKVFTAESFDGFVGLPIDGLGDEAEIRFNPPLSKISLPLSLVTSAVLIILFVNRFLILIFQRKSWN